MEKELIAGVFTIFGSILGGLLSKYGLPFPWVSKTIKCSGSGRDVNLASVMPELEDNSLYTYSFSNCVIKKSKHSAKISCHVSATKNGNTKTWLLNGEGPLVDGVAYCTYEIKPYQGGIGWKGLMALSFSNGGRVVGFWITENTTMRGKMAFGVVEMEII
ncbi:MAG: hypothetical protein ACR65O_00385 [Methylomicrobium sp.]